MGTSAPGSISRYESIMFIPNGVRIRQPGTGEIGGTCARSMKPIGGVSRQESLSGIRPVTRADSKRRSARIPAEDRPLLPGHRNEPLRFVIVRSSGKTAEARDFWKSGPAQQRCERVTRIETEWKAELAAAG